MKRPGLVARLPLAARLAARQLQREKIASALTIVALALPSTAVLAIYLAIRATRTHTDVTIGSPSGTVIYDVAISPDYLLTLAPIIVVIVVVVATIVGATALVRSRSQDRTLALLEAAGAGRALRFRIASSRGIILGLAAALLSVILGIVGAFAFVELFLSERSIRSLSPLALLLGSGAAIPIAWLASVLPVLQRRSRATLAELNDRPLPPAPRVTHSKSGSVLLLISLAFFALFALAMLRYNEKSSGFILILDWIGMLLVLPAVVLFIIGASKQAPAVAGALARRFSRSPRSSTFAARLAARDVTTSPGRTVPIVAAVMVICFIFATFSTLARANLEVSNLDYVWTLQQDQVSMNVIDTNWNDDTGIEDPTTTSHLKELTDAFDTEFDTESRTLRAVKGPYYGMPVDAGSGRTVMDFPDEGLPTPRVAESGPCQTGSLPAGVSPAQCERDRDTNFCENDTCSPERFPLSDTRRSIWVGDLDDLTLMLGHDPDAATLSAFERGDALLFDARLLDDRSALTLDWYGADQFGAEDTPGALLPSGTPLSTASVPATIVPLSHRIFADVFLSDNTARSLDLQAEPSLVLAPVDAAEIGDDWFSFDNAALNNYDIDTFVTVESGPAQISLPWTIFALAIAVGVCLIIAITATGLARFENRPAMKTLLSLGARPGIGSRVAGWHALIVIGYSGLVATISACLLTAAIWPHWVNPFWPGPLLEVGVLGIGLPVVAALIARVLPAGRERGIRP